MTALLSDANAFAMVLTDDPRLPGAARRSLAAADRAAISAISFHEMDRKVRLGRWPEMAPFAPRLVERGTTASNCCRSRPPRRWRRLCWTGITEIPSIE